MKTIDLNADVGEGYDDLPLLPFLSSVNIACGGHAGSIPVMTTLAKACGDLGIRIGAHPGYEDPENFGRKPLSIPDAELRRSMHSQVSRLMDVLGTLGLQLMYVKPHGALYNQACANPAIAWVLAESVKSINPSLALMCPESSSLATAARSYDLKVISEGFIDRAYLRDGSLAPRSLEGSVYEDPEQACAQALALAKGEFISSLDGGRIKVTAESLCVHGDTPSAWQMAKQVRNALKNAGFLIKA